MRRLLSDPALLHRRDLLVDDLALVVGVLAGDFVEVAVFRIDRLLVDDLGEPGAHVLHPAGDLRGFALVRGFFGLRSLTTDELAGRRPQAVRVACPLAAGGPGPELVLRSVWV